ncbi:MAG: TA system VapC family ribonuclease toxin [Candidatus Rokuibacteriota bacterium]
MTALLDVNVLVALAWPNHVHHGPALAWFERRAAEGWATCPLTQSGFVRVSSNPRVLPAAKTPEEAIRLLRRIVALPGHEFWADDVAIADGGTVDAGRIRVHSQVTDAHLLALARRRGGRLATFDRAVGALLPPGIATAHLEALS